jgi:hypothetical protein
LRLRRRLWLFYSVSKRKDIIATNPPTLNIAWREIFDAAVQ